MILIQASIFPSTTITHSTSYWLKFVFSVKYKLNACIKCTLISVFKMINSTQYCSQLFPVNNLSTLILNLSPLNLHSSFSPAIAYMKANLVYVTHTHCTRHLCNLLHPSKLTSIKSSSCACFSQTFTSLTFVLDPFFPFRVHFLRNSLKFICLKLVIEKPNCY